MKKIQLKKKTRQLLTVLLLILLIGSAAGLFWSFTRPSESIEEYTAYSCSQEVEIGYRVHLHPNEFFPESVLGAGRAYISELTDYLSTDFVYRFAGERDAEVKGEYSVTASLTAVTGREEKFMVWEQSYELLPLQRFAVRDKELTIREEIIVPYSEYVLFANRLTVETGYIPEDLSLNVTYHLAVDVETDSGTIREGFAPKMVVPLRGKSFVIGGNLSDKKTDGITATQRTPIPLVEETKFGFSAAFVIFLAMFITFLALTTTKEEKANFGEKKLSRILKEHGDRIVVFRKGMYPLATDKVLDVDSFDDLVKASDELGKPLLYNKPLNGDDRDHSFFVVTETCFYRHTIGSIGSTSSARVKKTFG